MCVCGAGWHVVGERHERLQVGPSAMQRQHFVKVLGPGKHVLQNSSDVVQLQVLWFLRTRCKGVLSGQCTMLYLKS